MTTEQLFQGFLAAREKGEGESEMSDSMLEKIRTKQREIEILFKLLDDYSDKTLHGYIKEFWARYKASSLKVDDNFIVWCGAKSKDPDAEEQPGDEYRTILYFWKKVALARKMECVKFENLKAAFANMDILEILIPVHKGVSKSLKPPQQPDPCLQELYEVYKKRVAVEPVKSIQKNDKN